MPVIETKECKTAEELWEYMAPTNTIFGQMDKVLFRGQGDSKWDLIPSILRDYHIVKESSTGTWLHENAHPRICEEKTLLLKFVEFCDIAPVRSDRGMRFLLRWSIFLFAIIF